MTMGSTGNRNGNDLRTERGAVLIMAAGMLVVLMGSGNGLRTGVLSSFGSFATNSFFMWGQTTSVPYKGFKKGRRVEFTNEDTEALRREFLQDAVALAQEKDASRLAATRISNLPVF